MNKKEIDARNAGLMEEARAHYNRGAYAPALEAFRRAAAAPGAPLEARCFAAHCLFSLGRPAQAASLLSKLVRAHPAYIPGALALADLDRWRKRPEAAEALYRKVLRLEPAHEGARKGLLESCLSRAHDLQARRRGDLAEEFFAAAVKIEPSRENLERLRDSRRQGAARAFARGCWTEALEILKTAQEARPAGAGAARELMELFRLGIEEARSAGRWTEVERRLDVVWALSRPQPAARRYVMLLLRGWIAEYSAAGDEKRLVRIWTWLLRRGGGDAKIRAEVSAGLGLLLGTGAEAERPARARRLLTPFLRMKKCPAAFRRRFIGLARQWAELAKAAGEVERARRLLDWTLPWAGAEAAPIRRDLVALHRRRAEAASSAGRWRAARRAWTRVVALSDDPAESERFEEAVRQRIMALRVRGRRAEAEGELREAIAESPLPQLRLQLAALLIQMGRVREAEKILSEVLAGARGAGDRLIRFQALAGLARYAEAFREAELILKRDRRARTAWLLSWPWKDWLDVVPTPGAVAAFRTRHIPALSALVARGAFLPWAHYYRGLLLRRTGTIVDGAADFDLAALQPDVHPWMLFEAGLSRLYRCDYEGAIGSLKRTLGATKPTNWMSYAFIGEALVCLRRPEAAFPQFDRALRATRSPDHRADALAWRGEMHLWLGQYREALAVLDLAVEAGARYAPTWRGAAKLRLGRVREALADLDAGVEVWDDIEAWIWRGEAKRLLGDDRGALGDLNHALRMSGDPWAYFNRALARANLGDAAGMRRDYARIPPALTAYASGLLGLAGVKDLDDRGMGAVLEAGLRANAGFRRHLEHQTRSWMI